MKENYSHSVIDPLRKEMVVYLRSLRPYFILTCTLFVLGIVAGYLIAVYQLDIANALLDEFEKRIQSIAGATQFEFLYFIFFNNAMVNFILIFSGIFFSILSVLIILTNWLLIGVVFFQFASQYGLLLVLIALIPHGIIELPITFTSASIGMKLGVHTFQKLFQIKDVHLKYELMNAIRIYFVLIIPLLLIAAFIETYVTVTILEILSSFA